jgi:ATP-dependent helicase HrpA
MESVTHVTRAWHRALDRPPGLRFQAATLAEIRWMLEELRISYFARTLGIPYPVSEKRVLRAIEERMS